MTGPTGAPDPKRRLVTTLYAAIRTARTSPTQSLDMRAAIEGLDAAVRGLADDGRLELRVLRQALFLDGERLASDIENYVFYQHVLATLTQAGVGVMRLTGPPSPGEWESFLGLLVRATPEDNPAKTVELRRQMISRSIRAIDVEPPLAGGAELPGEEERREAAKRTYERSVAISRELFDGARLGRGAKVKEVKQAVEGIVDAVLHDEASLGGLSTLRDYDDYSFTHSVNVCIFCVAIGRRLGLSKAQLFDLGLAALVHDIGMSRIPREILTKGSPLTPEEHERMQGHTWLGALSIYQLRDYGEIPFQSMIVAYEHHLKHGGGGYPTLVRPREPSVFSKIVAVASAFDAATNERAYSPARPPDQVLRELWEDESRGHDPVIVKALINLLGIYPVGTLVILDTFELALVHAANSDVTFLHRPVVRILSDPEGRWLSPAPLFDLAQTTETGEFARTIIKVTSPERYGITVSDYFV